ncbi:hypothetical protein TREMEDRAFT_59866 [Tremella mesenterica DSM 1558]|uniref:uncharacterized protein n=1 Tax=Tremella mesenterica (strain ATCC 24925 / CBS 8224 / DSM 1558 / NBRC 9311 / NRRL Y-6157 / RJB 2259-6 / UBC 559-6) TaxID=578456 RepID=UPI0003F4948B|nr:uncharacterized protein TREMEDRAFT_59866 [Tremella mesenterica DSM 1558]EIW73692.1 hypothetical protein TREMEDRAFT_59866 [Tremella mesenterica DSM 1558]
MSKKTSNFPLQILREYAKVRSPARNIPPSVLLSHTPYVMSIHDAYPKSKYHFLILPRFPYPPEADLERDKSILPLGVFDSLETFLMKGGEHRWTVLQQMVNMARDVEEMIRDEMFKTEGFTWKIYMGFHAVPSMNHFKTKKHHNSFRPDLGFFVPLASVEGWIKMGDEESIRRHVSELNSSEILLSSPLSCFRCDESFGNMPELKRHLEGEFQARKKKALKEIATTGRQRDSDVSSEES